MTAVYVVVVVATVVANIGVAITDFVAAEWVLKNSAEVGVPRSWLPWLATLKTAGGVGLVVGFWVPLIGIAAAVGLVLFFVGAVGAHVRARVFHNIGFPVTYLALAVATLALLVTQ